MDDPFAGEERQHKNWRDLPPTPPLVWPASAPAYATAGVGIPSAPAARASERPGRRFVVGAALVVGALILTASGALTTGQRLAAQLSPGTAAGDPAGPEKAAAAVPPADEPLAQTAARLLPSVVQIEAGNAVGSGFVAADGGLILTASHVVGRSQSVTLRLQDGTSVPGTVVAVDKSIDTAVIRADQSAAPGLKPLPLGALADVQVGEMTIAVGSPFGLSQTVTHGIVSARERGQVSLGGTIRIKEFLQTDAAINPGSSGGPLFNLDGDRTAPTWFNSFLLAALSAAAWLIARDPATAIRRFEGRWKLMSLVLLAMSVDEVATVHEVIGKIDPSTLTFNINEGKL